MANLRIIPKYETYFKSWTGFLSGLYRDLSDLEKELLLVMKQDTTDDARKSRHYRAAVALTTAIEKKRKEINSWLSDFNNMEELMPIIR